MSKHYLSKALKAKKLKIARKLNKLSQELYRMCRNLKHM